MLEIHLDVDGAVNRGNRYQGLSLASVVDVGGERSTKL